MSYANTLDSSWGADNVYFHNVVGHLTDILQNASGLASIYKIARIQI